MAEVSYTEYVESLKAKFASFIMDADAGADNKSASLRARKLSMELRKDLQNYRKVSVENDQARTKKRDTATPEVAAEATV